MGENDKPQYSPKRTYFRLTIAVRWEIGLAPGSRAARRGKIEIAAHGRSYVQDVGENSCRYRPRGVRVGQVEYVFCDKDPGPFRRADGGVFAFP